MKEQMNYGECIDVYFSPVVEAAEWGEIRL